MTNIRINKLALELNVQNDQVMEELQKLEIKVKNYMSVIDEDAANQIRDVFSNNKMVKPKKTATKPQKASNSKGAKKGAPVKAKSTSKEVVLPNW